ncbi:MAG: DUF2341 domain-containing protein [Canidatus Methanoxibalbensis ujae]|nr:DUF2341 domain-containing protein [Candidatus Methanoxibalbensis ujae]
MRKVILCLLIFLFSIGTVSAFSLSGGGDWKYYREITIKENSGKTLTDYQILVELNSANFDFSKAKSDGSDIRFSTDSQELSYWIEEWDSNAKKAKIWVKVPLIPANGETNIKMYYGNPSAGAVSDGDKVFEFFDDFEGTSLDINKWSYEEEGTGNLDLKNGYAHFFGKKYTKIISHIIPALPNSLVGMKVRWNGVGTHNGQETILYFVPESVNDLGKPKDYILYFDVFRATYYSDPHPEWRSNRVLFDERSINSNKKVLTWFNVETILSARDGVIKGRIWESGNLYDSWHEAKVHSLNESRRIILINGGDENGESWFDHIFVAKYISPEPTVLLTKEGTTPENVGLDLKTPKTAPTPTPPFIYYEEDFETNPGYTSLAPEYAYWDSEHGNYYVKTFDNFAHKYWAYSPEFPTVDTNHQDIIIELDMKCENLDWGTYPLVAFYYDNPDTIENFVFRIEFHWDDPYGKNFLIADSYGHSHWANKPPESNVWYHVKLKYHASTQKVDIYITKKSTGESFYTNENADFRIDPFRYLGIGYYGKPDYGDEWSPIRVDNIRIAAIGKTALTPTPTPAPPTVPEGKIKAVWLYDYDRYDLPTLMNDLKSAGINTIFLSTDVNNIWKYERFVKTAHENGIEVHAMILEIADNKEEGIYDYTNFYKNPYHKDEAVRDVEKILNYNEKSLGAFDGINIDIEPYTSDLWNSNREDVWNDYMEVINAIKKKINGRTELSADILYDSRDYTEDRIKDLASVLDFFVIMAYDSGGSGFNTPEEIKDAVAQEMGSVRGQGAKAVIGIGIHEGFGDKSDVESCINDLFDYYSDDPAFLGISIFRYHSYSELPDTKKTPEGNRSTEEQKEIPGFECIFAITLLAVAYILRWLKNE